MRLSLGGADHLLAQPRPVALVEEVKLDALLPDRRVELDRDIDLPETNLAFPDRPCRHGNPPRRA